MTIACSALTTTTTSIASSVFVNTKVYISDVHFQVFRHYLQLLLDVIQAANYTVQAYTAILSYEEK